ncbi:MAG: AurF N-oxygenase family protein [Microthrixaceae bacterium]
MSLTTDDRTALDDEPSAGDDAFVGLLARLNDQSVRPGKHFDAYVDVPWDDHPIDPTDPRWELRSNDPLGATAWYQGLPQDVRARIGLHGIASKMQIGYFFEGVLKRGLLEHSTTLAAGSPELRYVYHEVIEEAQHSLMFQEFAGRAGYGTVPDVPRKAVTGSRRVVSLARVFPELFFIFVLGGEDPIDHMQREVLRDKDANTHPLLERIMRIHVTEEARHLSFARHWLKQSVPKLGPVRRTILSFGAPMILGEMGGLMMRPSKAIVTTYDIPAEVLREAYDDNSEWQQSAAVAMRKVRVLCRDLGLMNPLSVRLWKAKKIWADD